LTTVQVREGAVVGPKIRPGIALVIALAAGCAPRVPLEERAHEARLPVDFPIALYRQSIAERQPVFRVDAGSSIVIVEVRRAGSLARLGHDHVVASHDLHGFVLPDGGRADLYVALDELVVDEPALRSEAGFDTEPSAEAVAGTRRNMLEKTLETGRFPFATIGVRVGNVDAATREAETPAVISITLHGVTRDLPVPIRIATGPEEVVATGRLTIAQTDFGIEPLSILGGAIQVEDRADMRFEVHARRTSDVRE